MFAKQVAHHKVKKVALSLLLENLHNLLVIEGKIHALCIKDSSYLLFPLSIISSASSTLVIASSWRFSIETSLFELVLNTTPFCPVTKSVIS